MPLLKGFRMEKVSSVLGLRQVQSRELACPDFVERRVQCHTLGGGVIKDTSGLSFLLRSPV